MRVAPHSPRSFPGGGFRVAAGRLPRFLLCGEQPWQPGEVVRGKREGELATNAIEAAQHGLGHWPHGLAPAKGFLDPFADALANSLCGIARCAPIDG